MVKKGLLNDRDEKSFGGDIRYTVYTDFLFLCSGQCRPNVSGVKQGGKEEVLLTFLIRNVDHIFRLGRLGNSDD